MENIPAPFQKDHSGLATAGLVLGIIGIIGWIIPICGFPITILAVIFGSIGLKSQKRGAATAGLILGIIGIILTILNSLIGAITMANLLST